MTVLVLYWYVLLVYVDFNKVNPAGIIGNNPHSSVHIHI